MFLSLKPKQVFHPPICWKVCLATRFFEFGLVFLLTHTFVHTAHILYSSLSFYDLCFLLAHLFVGQIVILALMVSQMEVSRRSRGLSKSPVLERRLSPAWLEFCVPAIQDDTLKVKAVTARLPRPARIRDRWKIEMAAESRRSCRSAKHRMKKLFIDCGNERQKYSLMLSLP